MLTHQKKKSLQMIRQTKGTVEKVEKMVEQDTYCMEIMQQIDSIIGMLNKTKKELLTGHLEHCLEHKIHEDKEKTIQELLRIYKLSQS